MEENSISIPNNNLPNKKSKSVPPQNKAYIFDDGDNTKFIDFTQVLMNLPPPNLKDLDSTLDRINEYFSLCRIYDLKPTVTGLAMSLNIDRRRLWEIVNNKPSNTVVVRNMPADIVDAVKKAYFNLAVLFELYALHGKINPMVIAFLGVNDYGYQDVKQIQITPVTSDPLGEVVDELELQEKYRNSLPENIE